MKNPAIQNHLANLTRTIKPHAKIVVGISGGVDSAVAAFLLKEAGYQVSGVFMQNWQANDQHCSMNQDLKDAEAVCKKLHIPLEVANFADEYWNRVFKIFLDEYAAGRTPNPDVLCNREIKFKAFLDHAINERKADYIATGHYARCLKDEGCYRLLRGVDYTKDQSYFLCLLTQQQLARSIFPLGELTKQEVRTIARAIDLPNATKKDSTGVCFIGERKFKKFLQEYLLTTHGKIMTIDRRIVGEHEGLMFYTIGQRQGLRIGGVKNADEAPWYVVKKDLAENVLYVVQDKNHPALWSDELICQDLHWISGWSQLERRRVYQCSAQVRYRTKAQPCSIEKLDSQTYKVKFANRQWAVASGQYVVFYQDDVCLGGAVILSDIYENS